MAENSGLGIEEFLAGKNIFVTGSTGFLAKVLIEKILRTVPGVGKLFLLIRAKNKEDAMERLENEIVKSELFKCLREVYGESYQDLILNKLVPVIGNVSETNLGLDSELGNVMADEVHIIVNSAANTTFHERYDTAIDINTRGPSHVMSFAKKCKKLQVFVHVSTAYVNGMRQGRVMEKPFRMGDTIARELKHFDSVPEIEPKLNVEDELELANRTRQQFENDTKHASKKLKELGLKRARHYGWQDTYIFTKAMGEMMINSTRENIPVVIIRPSIIESTYKEPFPGWIGGNRMLDPMISCYGKGQLNSFLSDPNGVVDVVPADMVVNAMVAAMTEHGAKPEPAAEMKVYQVTSSVTNPLVIEHFASLLREYFEASPCLDSKGRPIRVPVVKMFASMKDLSDHLSETISGQPNNSITRSPTGDLKIKKSVERVKTLAKIYEPYGLYRGRFDSSNTKRLMEAMDEEEKKKFGFDLKSVDWKDYFINVHVPGFRRYVMHEDAYLKFTSIISSS